MRTVLRTISYLTFMFESQTQNKIGRKSFIWFGHAMMVELRLPFPLRSSSLGHVFRCHEGLCEAMLKRRLPWAKVLRTSFP